MKNFTIENETNNITLHGSAKEAEAVPNSERFSNEAALAKIAANWPAARLAEIWNSLPGETPVRKFKDRATAASRIWKALQTLGQAAPAAEEPAPLPETAPVAEFPETAPVPERIEEVTPQPEAVIPGSTEPAVATVVATGRRFLLQRIWTSAPYDLPASTNVVPGNTIQLFGDLSESALRAVLANRSEDHLTPSGASKTTRVGAAPLVGLSG